MGRRKIEIQPITHERNRSVTFLKRKNGLFKKAYELGVLCSVDVAVIIFEERPGHHVKLYQYCSGNIDDIVQRHARYDGEKDIRTPNDFSGNSSTKLDDAAEGDDDDVEDDELEPPPARGNPGIKRDEDIRRTEPGPGPKLRPHGSSMDMDYPGHRPMIIPNPPMSMTTGHSSIPISGERLHPAPRMSSGIEMQGGSGPNKKPRIASNMDGGRGRSPQDEMSPTVSEYGYHPVSAPHVYRGPHPGEQYPPFLPPQSFPPGPSFDYPPSRMQYRAMNYPPTRSMPSYMQHSDQHFMRPVHHQYPQHHPGYPPMMTPQQHPSDVFSAFLDADPRQQHTGQGFAPIDWPVHAPPQQGRPNHSQGDPSDISWFDFLSSSAPNPSSGPMPASSSSLPTSARDNMSWEREWPSTSSAAVASRSPSRPSSNASDIASHPHKRSRVESDTGGGYGNEKGKDIEIKSVASGTNAIKDLGDGRGQGVEHDSDEES